MCICWCYLFDRSRTIYCRQVTPREATEYIQLKIFFFKIKFSKYFKSINVIYLDYKHLLLIPKLTAM